MENARATLAAADSYAARTVQAQDALPHIGPRFLDILDALEMRVRTIISPDGEMRTMLPRQREVNFYQAKRNFGSGA